MRDYNEFLGRIWDRISIWGYGYVCLGSNRFIFPREGVEVVNEGQPIRLKSCIGDPSLTVDMIIVGYLILAGSTEYRILRWSGSMWLNWIEIRRN